MAFALDTLTGLRPFLYHLIAPANLRRLTEQRALESVTTLASRAEPIELLASPRKQHVPLVVDGEQVLLRDQPPFHPGNIRLEDGWSPAQFVQHLH